MAPKKDPKAGKKSTKSRDSPIDGGFLEVKPKVRVDKPTKKESKSPAGGGPPKGYSASVGHAPEGPEIFLPDKENKWAKKQPRPNSPKIEKEKFFRSEKPVVTKSPMTGKSSPGGKASVNGTKPSPVLEEDVKSQGHTAGPACHSMSGQKSSFSKANKQETSSSKETGQKTSSSMGAGNPEATVASPRYLDPDDDLPDDYNSRPQPRKRKASPVLDENNMSLQDAVGDDEDGMEDYNMRQRPRAARHELEHQDTMYSTTDSALSATMKDAGLCEDLDKKIREAEENFPIEGPISKSLSRKIKEAESKFDRKSPSSNESPISKKPEPESQSLSQRTTSPNTVEGMKVKEQKRKRRPDNPLLPLMKELFEEKFLAAGMAGDMIRTGLQQYLYAQMDQQSQQQQERYSARKLEAILSRLEGISRQELEELSDQVISQYGNLLTDHTLTPQELNTQFQEFENDLAEEYRHVAEEGIMAGISGREEESWQKSGVGARSAAVTGEEGAGSTARMVETIASMFSDDEADLSHHDTDEVHHAEAHDGSSHHAAAHHEALPHRRTPRVIFMMLRQPRMYSWHRCHDCHAHRHVGIMPASRYRTQEEPRWDAEARSTPQIPSTGIRARHPQPRDSAPREDRGHGGPISRDAGHRDPDHGDAGRRNPGHGDAGRRDPGHGDPGRRDPNHGDAGRRNPGHGDPGRRDPNHGDPGRRDPGHGDRGRRDPNHGDPGRRDPGHGNRVRRDLGHGDAGRRDPGHGDLGHGDAVRRDLGHGDPGRRDPGHGDTGRRDLGHGDAGRRGPGHGESRYGARGPSDPGHRSPERRDPGSRELGARHGGRREAGRPYDLGLAALFRLAPAFTREEWRDVERNPYGYLADLPRRGPPGRWMESRHFTGQNYEAVWDLAVRVGMSQRGLSAGQVRGLQRIRFSIQKTVGGSKEEVECAVCLMEYHHKEMLIELPCKHQFHEDCIKEWLKNHSTCPVCRKDLRRH